MKGGRSGSQNPKCRRPPTTPRPRLPRSGRKAPTLSSHGRRVTVVELLTTERGKSRCPSVFYGAVRASGQSQAGTMRRSLLRRCGEHGVSAVQQLRISSNLHRVTRPRRGSSTRRSPRPSSSAVRSAVLLTIQPHASALCVACCGWFSSSCDFGAFTRPPSCCAMRRPTRRASVAAPLSSLVMRVRVR